MEEKKSSGIGVVIVILVIAIAIICAMGYYIYTTRINENSEIAALKTQLRDVQSQNNSYKDKIDRITEVLDENTKQEEKKQEVKKEEEKKEELSITDDVVEKVYNYVLKSDDTRGSYAWQNEETASFYRDEKVDFSSLSNIEKLITLIKNIKEKQIYDNSKKSEMTKLVFESADVNNINISDFDLFEYAKISDSIKKIFNKSVDELDLSKCIGCSWGLVYEDDSLYEIEFSGGGLGETKQGYGEVQKAEKEGNKLYIYDKYMYVDFTNSAIPIDDELIHIYTSSDETTEVASMESSNSPVEFDYEGTFEEYKDELDTYLHTFEKNENGDYYWVSSEKVEK